MSTSDKALKGALLAGVAVLTMAAPALAQEATSSDEIVVTAQRRAQNVQDVPISVQVVTSDTINAVAADDIGDLSAFTPGLSVSNSSPTQPHFSIRGVSTSDFGVGTDPAVGVYVDGVYAARSGAGLLAFDDVARIEVLKGPQGTLFGRNSAAGAVSITTNQPSDHFEARLNLRAGEFDKRRAEGMVNLPITDGLAFRMNAVINQRDGWLHDGATGEEYDREDNWAMRSALRWDATPDTTATLAYSHDNLDQDARPAISIIDQTQAVLAVPADPNAFISPFRRSILNDAVDNHETRSLDEATLTITHDFGAIDLTSLTSARYFETENREDEDGTNRRDHYFDTNNREKNHSWYQEFRLAGQSDRFDWITGVSYYHEHAQQRSDTFTFTDGLDTLAQNAFGFPIFTLGDGVLAGAAIPDTLFGLGWSEDMINDGDFNASAVFADLIWHVTPKLNVTVGARYTHDEKTFQWFNGRHSAPELDALLARPDVNAAFTSDFIGSLLLPVYNGDFIFDLTPSAGIPCDNGVTVQEGVTCQLEDSWNDISPRFVLDYRFTDHIMAYFSYAKGYKAGGFNSVQPASRFRNEDVDNYEIGLKTDLAHGLRFNTSLFRYMYNGKQSITLDTTLTVPQYVVTTSDDEAWGADFEINWAATSNLTVFANGQYIDATYKNNVTPGGLDLSGQPTGEPNWSLSAGLDYTHTLAGGSVIDLSLLHSYRGEARCNDDSRAQFTCGANPVFDPGEARNRTDFRGYWRSANERYEFGLYVNNLFDEQYVTDFNNITASTFGTPFVSVVEPRMWGVDFTLTY